MAWSLKKKKADYLENSITEGVIWKTLLSFFFPILLGTFFQQMYNTVDAIIVGKFVGKEALAAVGGTTGSIINLIVGFFTGLASGATVILSQYYGGRKYKEVGQTVHTAFAMAIAGGLLIMAFGLVMAPAMLRMLDTPEDIMAYSLRYLRIYFAGMVPSLIYNIGSGLLRAVGDSRRPLFFLIIACMTNVVLDVVFVVGLEMHVAGAALATILSQLVSAVLVSVTLMRSGTAYRLELKKIRFHAEQLKRIVTIGLPAGLQSMAYSVSNAIVQTSINGFGTDVVAAYTAYGKLDAFNWMLQGAFGVSITTFAGQNFGACQYERVKKGVRVCLAMSAAATLVLSGFLLLTGETLYRLFTDDPVVVELGMKMLKLLAPVFVLYVCIEIFSGALRGAGDSVRPTIITLSGVCALRMLWLLVIVPMNRTLDMVLYCYPLTWTVTSLLFVLYYYRSGWMKRCIHKAGLDRPLEEN